MRYLSGAELARLSQALAELPDQNAANAVRLLLLTGARRSEALEMNWGELNGNGADWVLPASRNKVGRELVRLQCHGSCSTPKAMGALVGGTFAAGGVAVVAVLTLRAMGEWRRLQRPP